MMYLKICTLQQTSRGDATDCQYQRYDGDAKSTKTTIHAYLPRPLIGTSRQMAARSKTSISSIQTTSNSTSNSNSIKRSAKKITAKQAIAALESYEKARQLASSPTSSSSANTNINDSSTTTTTTTKLNKSNTLNDSTTTITSKPNIRKVPRRTISDAMDNAFKNIFDQMSTYKSDIKKRMVEPTPISPELSTPPTVTTTTDTTTASTVTSSITTDIVSSTLPPPPPSSSSSIVTSDPVQVEQTIRELTELLQDPQRLSILQQLITALKEQTPSSR